MGDEKYQNAVITDGYLRKCHTNSQNQPFSSSRPAGIFKKSIKKSGAVWGQIFGFEGVEVMISTDQIASSVLDFESVIWNHKI